MAVTEFETDAAGTTLSVQVEVVPQYFRPETEDQSGFADYLADFLRAAATEYSGPKAGNPAPETYPPEAIQVLADVFLTLGELQNPPEGYDTPARSLARFSEVERRLTALADFDPRFVVAKYVAGWGMVEAGDFGMNAAAEVLDVLMEVVPLPEESDEGWVFDPQPWKSDPDSEIELHAQVLNNSVVVRMRTEEPAFALLRELGKSIDEKISRMRGLAPVLFYGEAAYAKRLCELRFSNEFMGDLDFRERLIEALSNSLEFLALQSERYDMPLRMANILRDSAKSVEAQALLPVIANIEGWLPRFINELVPAWWITDENEDDLEGIVDGLSAGRSVRLIAVVDEGSGQLDDAGLPKRQDYQPIALSCLTREFLEDPEVMLFAEEV